MKITCKEFPGKEFTTKEQLFTELRINAAKIIALKKAQIHESYTKGGIKTDFFIADKISGDTAKVGPQMKEGYIYPVINTTNYMDSHDDCHFPGIWNKSAKEQAGKIYYAMDHKLEADKIIAWPSDVNLMVKTVPWSFVGKEYEGNTEALIYEIAKASIVHDGAKRIIEEKRPVQNSVRMRYVIIKLGMNSTAKEDILFKDYYDSRIEQIANKDVVNEQGYFFGVEEAMIVTEGSMVIRGSNDATPIRQKDEADTITSDTIEPVIPTTQTATKFINPNFY